MENKVIEQVLNQSYKKWVEEKMKPIYKQVDVEFSKPFFAGVPSTFKNSRKTILIYGQEANNFFRYEDDWSIQGIQEWCREYSDIQLNAEYHPRKNSSPFWKFIRLLASNEVNVIWSNLDKVHLYKDGKTASLDVEKELWLNGAINDDNKTIVDLEIEAIKPNVVVFAVGPSYYKSLSKALNKDSCILNKYRPSKGKSLVDISEVIDKKTSVFWTYHPKYQSYIKTLDNNVTCIKDAL